MDKNTNPELTVFNSLSRQKEVFKPINETKVGMYVCGPTVYGEPHLGHARSAITFDIVYRVLSYFGYKVRYVRNITDVGHLEDDVAGEGEDKVAKKARLEQIEPMEVVQFYTNKYHEAVDSLNCRRPSIEPSASGHIIEQIEIINKIIDNGYAYEENGSVYFDMEKYNRNHKYGELSGKVLEDLIANSRDDLAGQSEKKGDHDFALWKQAKPEHIMKWSSPWGMGFPGWHLECTAMSAKYLGVPFDIHGGGMDLQFPHHEGEIAQCCGAFGVHPVNYWIHNNMVTLDGEKMAKRKGNFITLDEMFSGDHELLEKAYSPMTVRFFMLQSHYKSIIDFSNEALQASEKGVKKLLNTQDVLNKLVYAPNESLLDTQLDKTVSEHCDMCIAHLCDDFNTAKTIAVLFELSAIINSFYNKQRPIECISLDTFERMKTLFNELITEVLGISNEQDQDTEVLDDVMNILIEMRADARKNKDFALSDRIRDDLAKAGVMIKDEKEGGTSYTLS